MPGGLGGLPGVGDCRVVLGESVHHDDQSGDDILRSCSLMPHLYLSTPTRGRSQTTKSYEARERCPPDHRGKTVQELEGNRPTWHVALPSFLSSYTKAHRPLKATFKDHSPPQSRGFGGLLWITAGFSERLYVRLCLLFAQSLASGESNMHAFELNDQG